MKRILILGAGFAGIEAAVHLETLLGGAPGYEITLINEHNYFLFTPLLPQIPSSYINPRHIVQPVRDIRGRRQFQFRRDDVQCIDCAARRVELASAATRGRRITFVVVGGGYTGVELITELQDFLFQYVAPRYRGIPRSDIQLILLEASPQILRGVHPSLARHAEKRLRVEGIKIRTGARVTRCFEGGVEIEGGEVIRAETVVWAAGVRAHRLVESLPGGHDRIGRAMVNEHLQLEAHSEVFIIGDSGAALSAPDAPRVAPVAIDHGAIAARNIAHLERSQPLESYRYVAKGMLVSLGMNHAVVSIAGLNFHGYFAWLFWNAVHLYKLVGFKKQVQVALDWMLGSFFPRDASTIRRPRR
jgi:NADH dehydrogenase